MASSLTQYYLDFLRNRGLVDLYQKVAAEAVAKFPESRAVASHFVGALLRKKDYKGGSEGRLVRCSLRCDQRDDREAAAVGVHVRVSSVGV